MPNGLLLRTTTRFLLDAVFAFKPLNTSGGVNQLLLTGKKRMALRANFNLDIFGCGTGLDLVSTCTPDSSRFVFGMNSLLHNTLLLVLYKISSARDAYIPQRISFHSHYGLNITYSPIKIQSSQQFSFWSTNQFQNENCCSLRAVYC